MARKLRIEYPGAIYHVMNRGDRREEIFRDDKDRELFLATLAEACAKAGWQVHAYCLMGNHFHLVVETPKGNLVAGMKRFLGTYTARFNRRHKLFGHLFSGRYKSLVVDAASPGYLRTVCEYVHLNLVRAKLLRPEQPLRAYRWSSLPAYLERPGRRPAWLRVDRALGELGIPKDSATRREQFERVMEERRQQESPEEYRQIRRGWCWGEEALRKELLAQVDARRRVLHPFREMAEGKIKEMGWMRSVHNWNAVWQVKTKSGVVELEAGLDLNRKQIALRRCDGKDWPVIVFSLNGRVVAADSRPTLTPRGY
jgi:putative transposase